MRPRALSPLALSLLAAGLLAACSSKGASSAGGSTRSGADLYTSYCAMCHGAQGEGSSMNLGPSYRGIARHWDVAKLLEYVDDPQAYAAKDDRLGEREMTALPKDVSPEERQRLVEYALTLMD